MASSLPIIKEPAKLRPARLFDVDEQSNQIIALARQVDAGIEPADISLLPGGFSSRAYKVNAGYRAPFVLLVERNGAVSNVHYGHAYTVLTLLKRHNYKHSPEPLWLSEGHNAMAMSYFGGTASDKFNFKDVNAKQLATEVIDSLLEVASITLDEYKRLAKQLRVNYDPVETMPERAKKHGTEWLKTVQQSCPDKAIIDWLGPRVQHSLKLSKTLGGHQPALSHGDLSNPNILIKQGGEFMLIDWGSARFNTAGPEFFVAYATHLIDFMRPYRKVLTNYVAKSCNIPPREFTTRVKDFRKCTEIFDINWAAMMMAKASLGETRGSVESFRNVALKRIKSYEKGFGKVI